MKKIIFFSTPAYGHVFSILPLIKALSDTGYEVVCYSTESFRPYFEKCNVTYIEYSIPFEDVALNAITTDFCALAKALTSLNRQAFLAYDELIKNTDANLILYDSMCSFAKNLAYKYHKTCVCLATTMAYNLPVFLCSNMFYNSIPLFLRNAPELIKMQKEENDFRKKYHLKKLDLLDLFMNVGDVTLVFTPKEFQPFYKTFPEHVHFVGTTIKNRISLLHEEAEYDTYDYYISMGSIFTEKLSKYETLFSSTAIADQKILAVTGGKRPISKKSNLTLIPHVSQIDVLPHCHAFINHGGLNSVYESIYFGIPQLCIPQQEEQRMTALVAQRKNVAYYARHLNMQSIYKFEQKKKGFSLQKWQKIFKSYDGTARALAIIKKMLDDPQK